MTPASKVELSAGYQPRVNGADGVPVGEAVGDAVADGAGLTVVALGVADGVAVDDGVAVGGPDDGTDDGTDVPEDVGDKVRVTDGDGAAGADAVIVGPVLDGAGRGGDPVSGPASALPPTMAEATVRTVPVLITTHFSTRIRRVIPANDSS